MIHGREVRGPQEMCLPCEASKKLPSYTQIYLADDEQVSSTSDSSIVSAVQKPSYMLFRLQRHSVISCCDVTLLLSPTCHCVTALHWLVWNELGRAGKTGTLGAVLDTLDRVMHALQA